ncbi:MAG: response regulator transcription factor [Thermoanaerobaculia bacterium]|nr:response regulator transcription factor [Thermoanaerobaculia bacterium]
MRVLVIEDSERLRRSLSQGLQQVGYAVDLAADGSEGLDYLESYEYDAVILDLMLPKVPGIEVLRRLRAKGSDVHVLILSARDQVEDRVEGLQLGADDYLIKPFSFDELCARLQALIRRRYQSKSPHINLGSVLVDISGKSVHHDGKHVPLTPSEYSVFEFLLLRRGRVTSQRQITEHIYHSDEDISSNVIEVLISGIRRKLGDEARLLETRRGFGYVIQ